MRTNPSRILFISLLNCLLRSTMLTALVLLCIIPLIVSQDVIQFSVDGGAWTTNTSCSGSIACGGSDNVHFQFTSASAKRLSLTVETNGAYADTIEIFYATEGMATPYNYTFKEGPLETTPALTLWNQPDCLSYLSISRTEIPLLHLT